MSSNVRYLANIWPTNNLAGIVISVKILGLKFLPYIEVTCNQYHYIYVGGITDFYQIPEPPYLV